jgi:hypothetical protein
MPREKKTKGADLLEQLSTVNSEQQPLWTLDGKVDVEKIRVTRKEVATETLLLHITLWKRPCHTISGNRPFKSRPSIRVHKL